jgi:hypothetical protein
MSGAEAIDERPMATWLRRRLALRAVAGSRFTSPQSRQTPSTVFAALPGKTIGTSIL